MTMKDCTNLLVSRNLVLETVLFVQQTRTKLLCQKNISEEDFNKIFEDIEIPLCRIADEIATVIDRELLSPVASYQEKIQIVTKKVQNVINNSENSSTLIAISSRLLSFFHKIVTPEGTYPDTLKILDNVESICNQY